MSPGRRTALIALAAGISAQVLLDLAYNSLGGADWFVGSAGIGTAAFLLLIGRKADTYPWWFGFVVAGSTSIATIVGRAIWGKSCPI